MAASAHPTKSLVAYLLLVVPPFCGLLGILHVGDRLEPPRSIGGTWVVERAAAPRGDDPCAFPDSSGKLRVSQSGPRAELTFLDETRTSLSIELRGDRIAGAGRVRSGGRCGELAVEARLIDRDTLDGTLRRPGCADCPAASFHAVREPPRKGGEP
jgi:hypothetical protein